MQTLDNDQIREFLGHYRAEEPSPDLLRRTKCLMYEEMHRTAAAESKQIAPVLILAGLSLLLCLNLFYIATVGTILHLTLPASMLVYLRHSMIALGTAGVCMLTGSLIVVFFKVFTVREVAPQRL